MKSIISITSLILLIVGFGCQQSTEPALSDMYVNFEIESAFQNDAVRLILDDQLLIDSSVTTNYTVSLAWSSGLRKLSKTTHVLLFAVVDYGIQQSYTVDATNDTSTVLLRFNKETMQISIQQIKGRLLRD